MKKRHRNRWLLAGGIVALLWAIGTLSGSDDGNTQAASAPPAAPPAGQNSPAENLAAIELGYRPDAGDAKLTEIEALLRRAGDACASNSPTDLADLTALVIRDLEGKDVEVVPSQVLQDVLTATDVPQHIGDCEFIFSGLVPLYEAGAT